MCGERNGGHGGQMLHINPSGSGKSQPPRVSCAQPNLRYGVPFLAARPLPATTPDSQEPSLSIFGFAQLGGAPTGLVLGRRPVWKTTTGPTWRLVRKP